MKKNKYLLALPVGLLALLLSSLTFAQLPEDKQQQSSQLNGLIELALMNDASRKQFYAKSQSLRESGIASNNLKDPKLKVGVGGLPVDSFAFDEDPMTNISIGLMQEFERGSTSALQQEKFNHQAQGVELQVKLRERDVANQITQLWLELGYQQHVEQILLQNRALMLQLEQYIESNYALAKSEVQDLLEVQIQVSRLDEKIQANQQMQLRIVAQLSEWLGGQWLTTQEHLQASANMTWPVLEQQLAKSSNNQYYSLLATHPMVAIANTQIAASKTQISIAEQDYSPKFGVEVMYGYRQANGMDGSPASDLLSAYLTMDIPIFTDKRQDRKHAAAQHKVVEAQANKMVIIERMNAQVNTLLVDRQNLNERLIRYQQTILPQLKAKTAAVERAYQNNNVAFSEVIKASSDQLNIEIERWRLTADLNKTNSQLAYFLGGFEYKTENLEQSLANNSAGQ